MPTIKAKLNRRLIRWIFPARIAEYALETGMAAWAVLIAVNMAAGETPSTSLGELPLFVRYAWAGFMMLAGATIIVGLFIRPRAHTIARGMYLMGTTLLAYSAAVAGTSSWARGGAIAGFLLAVGLVCLLRGWWLNAREALLEKEMAREHEGK